MKNEAVTKRISANLRTLFDKSGMKQNDLLECLYKANPDRSYSQPLISAWLSDGNTKRRPEIEDLLTLAKIFHVSIDEIVSEDKRRIETRPYTLRDVIESLLQMEKYLPISIEAFKNDQTNKAFLKLTLENKDLYLFGKEWSESRRFVEKKDPTDAQAIYNAWESVTIYKEKYQETLDLLKS